MKRVITLLVLLAFSFQGFGAFTATAVWEVRTTGDDTNHGGGFDRGVAGFPTDGAATVATGNSPVFTSASYTFVAGDVGAWVYIKAGTNWTPGWYQIASVDAGAATLKAAVGEAVLDNGQGLNTVAGCATTASPTSGTWGVDYSQQANSQIAFTDMVIGSAGNETKFTSALNPVGKNFIGNVISVTAGTGFTVQRVAIVSTSTITATCDKALGTADSTGGVGELGGPLASPGQAAALTTVANQMIFVKSGAYTIASATPNIATGCVAPANAYLIEGYSAVRYDGAARPVLTLAASTATVITLPNALSSARYIEVDGALQTASRGFSGGSYTTTVIGCAAKNCTNSGFYTLYQCVNCFATGCTTAGAGFNRAGGIGNESYANTVPGFIGYALTPLVSCLSYGNTGATSDGFQDGDRASFYQCVSYGNGGNGFTAGVYTLIVNSIAEGNGGYGFKGTVASRFISMIRCAGYNNLANYLLTEWVQCPIIGFVSGVTGSFFTNAAAGDFSLNNTAGRGALLRATGFPVLFPAGLTASYRDIGAAQHADPPSGGHSYPIISKRLKEQWGVVDGQPDDAGSLQYLMFGFLLVPAVILIAGGLSRRKR